MVKLKWIVVSLALFGAAAQAAVPDSLLGETCQRHTPDDVEPEPGLANEDVLICDGVPAARLHLARVSTRGEDKAVLQAALQNPRLQSRVFAALECGAPQWLAERGVMALPCRHKNGGWPHLVVARVQGGIVRLAEGAPAQLPGLLSLIEASADDGREAHFGQLESLFGASLPLATSRERERFVQRIRQARAANQKGLHGEAERLLQEALAQQMRFVGEQDVALADTLLDLALLTSNQGREAESRALFARAARVLDTSPRLEDRARLNLYRGMDAANRGRFDEARQYAEAAVKAWRQLVGSGVSAVERIGADEKQDRSFEKGELAFALNLLAPMALRAGDLVAAQAAAAEALQIIDTTEGLPPAWRGDTLVALGEISIAQGRVSAAETYLNQAMALRRRLFGEGPPVWRAQALLGRAYQQEGLHASALVTLRSLLKALREQPAADDLSAEDFLPFLEAARVYGAREPVGAKRQAVWAETFEIFARARGVGVERTMSQTAARLAADQPALAALLAEQQATQRSLDETRLTLAAEMAAPDEARSALAEARLQDTLTRFETTLRALDARLQREHPDYPTLTGATPPTLQAVQAQLQPGEALVTFLFGRSHGYALLVRRDGVWLSRVNESQVSLEAAVTRLRAGLAVEGKQIGRFDGRLAHALHESLLGGLSEGLAGVEHLVVAQSGALASVPFGVLLHSAPANDDYQKLDWLAARVALTTVPGVRAFHALRTQPARRAPLALLGVGDPLIGQAAPGAESLATLCRGAGPAPQSALQALPRLPDTALELQRIRERLGASTPSRLLLGAEATEATLRQIALDQYRVVYFASHAVLPGELKCQSEPALVLTPPGESTRREDDGLLDASEIARLPLQADLVVLSACNTAGAQSGLGGEAFSGLAQAFFHAGTRALVASHWQVPSAATRQLMEALFAGLGPNIEGDTARALQQAQRQLIAHPATAHPVFWGAFVVVGDGRIAPARHIANQEAR